MGKSFSKSRNYPLMIGGVVFGLLYYIASSLNDGSVAQSIATNLSADAIIVGLTLAILDPWSKNKEHLEYAELEAIAILKVRSRIYRMIHEFVHAYTFVDDKDFWKNIYKYEEKPEDSDRSDATMIYFYKRDIYELNHMNNDRLEKRHLDILFDEADRTRDFIKRMVVDYPNALSPMTQTLFQRLTIKIVDLKSDYWVIERQLERFHENKIPLNNEATEYISSIYSKIIEIGESAENLFKLINLSDIS